MSLTGFNILHQPPLSFFTAAMETPSLNPEAPPFVPKTSITTPSSSHSLPNPLIQHPTQPPFVYPPSNLTPFPTFFPSETIDSTPLPYACTRPSPPPPPYNNNQHCYVVPQPPPYPSGANFLPGFSPSLHVYNIFNQQGNYLPQIPKVPQVHEQSVTPPVTTQHGEEVRIDHPTKVGPRAAATNSNGSGRGGFRAPRGRNGVGSARVNSLMVADHVKREGFGGSRTRVHHMRERRGGGESQRREKFGCWKATNKDNKHHVIPVRINEAKTTVMIKNIPYRCNRDMVMEALDNYCSWENQKAKNNGEKDFVSAYDFLYLPIDFRTRKSRGYAFVNFTNPRAVWRFREACRQQQWFLIDDAPKVIEIASATIQGKEAMADHHGKSMFDCDTDEFLPVCFIPARDGSCKRVKQMTIGKRSPRCGKILKHLPS